MVVFSSIEETGLMDLTTLNGTSEKYIQECNV